MITEVNMDDKLNSYINYLSIGERKILSVIQAIYIANDVNSYYIYLVNNICNVLLRVYIYIYIYIFV